MGIQLPSLQDIADWLLHQLKTWLAILVDTKIFVRDLRGEVRSDLDNVLARLASFAAFIFIVDAIFSFPYENFVLKLSMFSPSVLLSAIAIFCMDLILSLVCLHIALLVVARNRDLRVTLIFVLVMLAFMPIVNLAHAPIRLMFTEEETLALYSSNYEYFIQFIKTVESRAIARFGFAYTLYIIVFVWFLKRATVSLAVFYQISSIKSVLVILTSLIAKGFIGAVLIGPLLLHLMHGRPV